jgi:NhaP-type Na+/H+ or K+/H+ antiporter
MVALGVFACLIFGFGLVSRRLERTVVSAAMVFVAAGLVAGWTGVVELGSATHVEASVSREVVFLIAELALVLLLFTDAARIDPRHVRRNALPLRLLGIGLPLTIGLGTLLALVLLSDLEAWECAIVAAVLAPTDAALGQAVVSSPLVPLRVREALNVESGLNDGGSVPFLMLFVALAAAHEGLEEGWLRFTAEQIGYATLIGAAVGGAGGAALRRAAARDWTTTAFERLALAALAIAAWYAADEAGGNGFIAAFVGGGAAGIAAGSLRDRALDFAEEEGQMLNLAVFFIFGLFATKILGDVTWQTVAYAVLSLTVVRMLPVAVAVAGLGLRPATIAFLGWFGPRGLASIILALVVVEEEPALAGIDGIFLVMTVTVLLSVFAHGISAAPLTRRYALGDGLTPAAAGAPALRPARVAEREAADVPAQPSGGADVQ